MERDIDIFLSHLGDDSDFVINLGKKIEENQISTFYYERDIDPFVEGHRRQSAKAILRAKIVAAIISPSILKRNEKNFVEWELDYAFQNFKKIIYILKDISYKELPVKYLEYICTEVPVEISESDTEKFDRIVNPLKKIFSHSHLYSNQKPKEDRGDNELPQEKGQEKTGFEGQVVPGTQCGKERINPFLDRIGLDAKDFDKPCCGIIERTINFGSMGYRTGTPHLFFALLDEPNLPLEKFVRERAFPVSSYLQSVHTIFSEVSDEPYSPPSENLVTILHESYRRAAKRREKVQKEDILVEFLNINGGRLGNILRDEYGIIFLDLLKVIGAGNIKIPEKFSNNMFLFNHEGDLNLTRFDENMQHLLQCALDYAMGFGHSMMGRRHLLFAILKEKGGELNQRLVQQNLDPEELRALFGSSSYMPESNVAMTKLSLKSRDMSLDLIRILINADKKVNKGEGEKISEKFLIDALFEDPEDHLVQFFRRRGFKWVA